MEAIREAMYKDRLEAGEKPVDPNLESGPNPLWITVNKYLPAENSKAGKGKGKDPVTLLFAHANGFSREVGRASMYSFGRC